MAREIQGVMPVLHTPFDLSEQIDRQILRREIDWAFEVGCDGVCMAMVSEVLRLTMAERVALMHDLVEFTADRGSVVASIGAESVQQAVSLGHEALRAGCDAVMAIPPMSSPLPESSIERYYIGIAEAVNLPVIVQDASSYVGGAMSTSLMVRLLDRFDSNKIMFKPEASPIGPNLSALRDSSDGRARIFDGSGGILLIDAHRRGIVGTMPGTDLLDGVCALWNALEAQDDETAYRVYFPICAIVALQLQAGLDGFLAIEKYLMVKRGIFTSAARRQPYAWELDAETQEEVDRLFSKLSDALR